MPCAVPVHPSSFGFGPAIDALSAAPPNRVPCYVSLGVSFLQRILLGAVPVAMADAAISFSLAAQRLRAPCAAPGVAGESIEMVSLMLAVLSA